MARSPRNAGGRPPLNRQLRAYKVRVPATTKVELARQAAALGIRSGTYLRLLVSEALNVPWSKHDPSSHFPLPIAVSSDELRSTTAGLSRDDILAPVRGDVPLWPRLDDSLADLVESRADALDVDWAHFIGTIFSIAVGTHPHVSAHQLSLLDAQEAGPFDSSPNSQGARLAS